MHKETRLAYLAGALDGDGSFSLIKGTSHSSVSPLYYPMIQLANANKELVDLFYDTLGGRSSVRPSYVGKDGGSRLPSYYWKIEKSTQSLPVLESVIPYLVVKKQRAEFLRNYIINNPFNRGSNKLPDSLLSSRERAHIKMRSFNDNADINGQLLSKQKRIDSDSEIFWSYVAGLMDTDGSFSLKREMRSSSKSKSPVYSPSILLTMVDCRAIYYIMNNFSHGNMMVVKAKTATNGFCYRFSITGRKNAIIFLKKCIPFLVIKKSVASKLLEFCENMKAMNGKKGISEEESLMRQQYYCDVKNLNYGVYKSPLIDLETLPGNAEGNKAQAAKACSVNVASEETSLEEDAVL